MIISEKQILQLITCVRNHLEDLRENSADSEYVKIILLLLDTINSQQSEELKVIE